MPALTGYGVPTGIAFQGQLEGGGGSAPRGAFRGSRGGGGASGRSRGLGWANVPGYGQGASAASEPVSLSGAVKSLQSDAGRWAGLRADHMADVADTGPESRRFGASLSSRLAQDSQGNEGTAFADTLGHATKVAKARTGIQARGDKAIKNQQLMDRIKMMREGTNIRGQGVDAMGRAAQIREGVNVAGAAANDFARASKADMWGGIAGAGTRLIQDTEWGQGIVTGIKGFFGGGNSNDPGGHIGAGLNKMFPGG